MVPPGGTPHIAGGADPAHSGAHGCPMGSGARRVGAARIPRAAPRRLLAWPARNRGRRPDWSCARPASDRTRAGRTHPGGGPPGPARTPRPNRPSCPVPAWIWRRRHAAQPPPRYDDKVVAVFVHHTDSPNGYDCADAPRIIRYLYAGQTGARDWDDIGYNFLVDRCGTIYEGRAGGVDRPVTGAHTQGFNHRTAGIAALGTFTAGVPVPKAMTDAIAAVAAWKLGLAGIDPRGTRRLVSSNSLSRYASGTTATLPALAGHNDGLHDELPRRRPHAPASRRSDNGGPPPGADVRRVPRSQEGHSPRAGSSEIRPTVVTRSRPEVGIMSSSMSGNSRVLDGGLRGRGRRPGPGRRHRVRPGPGQRGPDAPRGEGGPDSGPGAGVPPDRPDPPPGQSVALSP